MRCSDPPPTPANNASHHRQIWSLTWPILLANLSTPLLGLVDTALLGRLSGSNELAAAAIGASIYSYVFWGFGFLRQGATGLTAQAYGRGDTETQHQLAIKNLLLATSLGTLLLLFSPLLISLGLNAMAISNPLFSHSSEYLQIRFFAAPFMLATFGLLGWFIGRQQSRYVMWVLLSTNLINIALDVWLIKYMEWGSQGAAIASSIAETFGFLLAIYFLLREKFQLRLKSLFGSPWRPLLQQNHFLFQRSLLLLFCFSIFTAQGEKFGVPVIAANAVLFQLLLFTSYFLDAYAHTIEALVGEAHGKEAASLLKADNHKKTSPPSGEAELSTQQTLQRFWIQKTALWNYGTALCISLLFFLLATPIAQTFSQEKQVQDLILLYMPWLISLPPIAAACYFLDGVFIGLTEVRKMRNSMIFSCLVFITCWLLWGRGSNHGLWAAMVLLHIARDISMGWYYSRIKLN